MLVAPRAGAQVFDPDTCWSCSDKMAHAVIGAGLDLAVRGPWITKSWRDTPAKRLAWVGTFAVANELMDLYRPALSGRGNVGIGLIDIVATVAGGAVMEIVFEVGAKILLRRPAKGRTEIIRLVHGGMR